MFIEFMCVRIREVERVGMMYEKKANEGTYTQDEVEFQTAHQPSIYPTIQSSLWMRQTNQPTHGTQQQQQQEEQA